MNFDEILLPPRLPPLKTPADWWVAYSGGLDSHVLLFALHRLLQHRPHAVRLKALHIEHGISPHAGAWAEHCRAICDELGIPLEVRSVTLGGDGGEGLEARARRERYHVFADILRDGGRLLQAHHRDDQMETLLYRLMRGSGPRGLSGIPHRRPLARGEIIRPLLDFDRQALEAYARRHGLRWIDDESNRDTAFDRNFLRHEILPRIEARWPGYRDNWQRSLRLCAETESLNMALARADFAAMADELPNRLRLDAFLALEPLRRRNVLRYWLSLLAEEYGIPLPDHGMLERILTEVAAPGKEDAPHVQWRDENMAVQAWRYRDKLCVIVPDIPSPDMKLRWQPTGTLNLPAPPGRLYCEPAEGAGLSLEAIEAFTVRFRAGGERVKPSGRKTRPLKKVFQDLGVPPWLRGGVPLIYYGEELVAAADLFVCEGWRRGGGEVYRIRWERSDIHCGY